MERLVKKAARRLPKSSKTNSDIETPELARAKAKENRNCPAPCVRAQVLGRTVKQRVQVHPCRAREPCDPRAT